MPEPKKQEVKPKEETSATTMNSKSFVKARVPHYLITNSEIIEDERLGLK
jgi:hypothetical protein